MLTIFIVRLGNVRRGIKLQLGVLQRQIPFFGRIIVLLKYGWLRRRSLSLKIRQRCSWNDRAAMMSHSHPRGMVWAPKKNMGMCGMGPIHLACFCLPRYCKRVFSCPKFGTRLDMSILDISISGNSWISTCSRDIPQMSMSQKMRTPKYPKSYGVQSNWGQTLHFWTKQSLDLSSCW